MLKHCWPSCCLPSFPCWYHLSQIGSFPTAHPVSGAMLMGTRPQPPWAATLAAYSPPPENTCEEQGSSSRPPWLWLAAQKLRQRASVWGAWLSSPQPLKHFPGHVTWKDPLCHKSVSHIANKSMLTDSFSHCWIHSVHLQAHLREMNLSNNYFKFNFIQCCFFCHDGRRGRDIVSDVDKGEKGDERFAYFYLTNKHCWCWLVFEHKIKHIQMIVS